MTMKKQSVGQQIRSVIKTTVCFVIFLLCSQPLVLSFFFLSIFRLIWRNIMIMKYPHLEFLKTENLHALNTAGRRPSIINVILQLNGEYNVETIQKAALEGVFQTKNKLGDLLFPKLSSVLVTCWGHFAWKTEPNSFSIKNHVTLYPANYRGRPITEANIQDYVSNIVSRHLPSDIPPWQICIVPTVNQTVRPEDIPSTSSATLAEIIDEQSSQNESSRTSNEQYFIIVRMHPLLLSEEPDLRLSDLLSIDSSTPVSTVESAQDLREVSRLERLIPKSPLTDILNYPVYIPQLYFRLQVALSNFWNEFLCKYDPFVGNLHAVAHSTPGSSPSTSEELSFENEGKCHCQISTLSQLFAVGLISFVTILTDFSKGFYATKNHPLIKLRYFNNLVRREIRKRSLTWNCLWCAILTSLNPISVIRTSIAWIWWTIVAVTLMWPYFLYRELKAFRCCWFLGYAGYPNTITGFLFSYLPLFYKALKECLHIIFTFIQAPRFIYEELIQNDQNVDHTLQNVSLCGRKVLSWSSKINVDKVRQACIKYKLSSSELYMSAASATIMELLNEFGTDSEPRDVRALASHRIFDYLLGKLGDIDNVTGQLCLKLPMEPVSTRQIQKIKINFHDAHKNQVAIYFLSVLQKRFNILMNFLPSVWTCIIYNYLSRRFTVSITEISKNTRPFQRCTNVSCWGHPVVSALYFSPPHSNGSVSLSIQQFGEHIQLGVITDAQIHPLHLRISEGWTRNLQKLL